jgi:hypothetical protein
MKNDWPILLRLLTMKGILTQTELSHLLVTLALAKASNLHKGKGYTYSVNKLSCIDMGGWGLKLN